MPHTPLRLLSHDNEDLEIVSAAVQDGIFQVKDAVWLPSARRFTLKLQRFVWEGASASSKGARVWAALSFDGVLGVKAHKIAQSRSDAFASLLSISFDPAHDDTEQLGRYAATWRANPRYWRIATVPDSVQLQRLLQAWQVVVISDALGGFEHNAALLVIDQHGRLVRIFDDTDSATALAFARALQQATPPGLPLRPAQ